jgi:signal transduction histidine kinase
MKFKLLLILALLPLFSYPISLDKIRAKDSMAYYDSKKDWIKALDYSKRKSEDYLKDKNYDAYLEISMRTSKIYAQLNENQKAIELLLRTLKYLEKNNPKINNSPIFIELGLRYSYLRDTVKSKKYYHKALKTSISKNDYENQKNAFQNLFRLHSYNNPDSSYYYMKKKFVLDKKGQSVFGLSASYNNHFVYYIQKGQYPTAKKYLDTCLVLSQKTDKSSVKITALSNLGYYYMVVEENYKKGADYYYKILDKYRKDMNDNELIETFLNLTYAYENLKEYEKANNYLNQAIEYKEKVYNNRISDATREVEIKYKINEIEERFYQEKKILEERQSRNKKTIIVFICLFIFSVILSYFYYQNLKLKQRNKIKEIDSEIQENIINASLDGQELERQKLSQVLHDSISALLSSAGLQLSAFIVNNNNKVPNEISKARALIREAHDGVRDLSHELVSPVLAKLGLYLAFQDLCEKNSNSMLRFELRSSIASETRFKLDFEIKIYYIVTELINNIIKHSDATSSLISIEEKNDEIILVVKDNGKGFDNLKQTINQGFGLSQIKARLNSMGGVLNLKSKKNEGSEITIRIKIPND